MVSREAMLVINNLLLSVILGLVLIGTLYPLLTERVASKLSVGPPYFNSVAGPVELAWMVVLAAGRVTRWRRDELRAVAKRVAVPIAAGALVLTLLIVMAGGRIGILPLLGLVLTGLVGTASIAPLWGRNLRRTPLFTFGMVIAHLGCAVRVAGMASESAFSVEK